ncbi:tetratricopeptide repeat protein [Piscinibacter koreensis]|uniref:Tetratricopeptide repeat protein n=1 Tax=Piscinibacter koreensis TaxID=2742824 RepID=A0A7Y6NJB5_9BURK|nr:tetratricopeptide repeat protein [Schlegelella koreensis]NUZ04243.1 tetratricopeptide repeat protein [Schlegelella koreensis]
MTADLETARARFFEGVAHFEARRFDAAEAAFAASLAVLPGRPSTLANLGATRVELGRFEAALAPLEQALAEEPDDLDAWSYRGVALGALGRHADALACHERVLATDARRPANWLHRGIALLALERPADALAAFDALLALQPEHAAGWFRHGQALQFLERHADALGSYERALALDPTLAQAWSNRGGILREMHRLDEAAEAYRQAIGHGADPELNGYYLASVTRGTAPAAALTRYAAVLFDDYAPTFEQHLVGVLNYRAHAVLVAGLEALRGGRRFASALDLGCGTGLCGPLVRPFVVRLEGVDVAPRMVEAARARGAYDAVTLADGVELLGSTPSRHDLVLAADVVPYLGELTALFAGVDRVLQPGGVFAFSAELATPEPAAGFTLQPSLRHAHAEGYLRQLAERHGLVVERVEHAPIREEQRAPVPGIYVYLGRPAGA